MCSYDSFVEQQGKLVDSLDNGRDLFICTMFKAFVLAHIFYRESFLSLLLHTKRIK
jgi:hypothetical protein